MRAEVERLKLDQQRKAARTLGTTQGIFAGLSLAAGIAGVSTANRRFESPLETTEALAEVKERSRSGGIEIASGLKDAWS